MKKIIWIIIVIAILGSLAWWGNSRTNISSSDTIKIGGELPLTGALASFGEEFQRGAKIAEDEINQTHQTRSSMLHNYYTINKIWLRLAAELRSGHCGLY
jgi:hypothetical protein